MEDDDVTTEPDKDSTAEPADVVEQSIGPDEPFNPLISAQAQSPVPGVRVTAIVAYVEYLDPDGKVCVDKVTDRDLSDARVQRLERRGRKRSRREPLPDLSAMPVVQL